MVGKSQFLISKAIDKISNKSNSKNYGDKFLEIKIFSLGKIKKGRCLCWFYGGL